MSDLIQEGTDWLASILKTNASQLVTYKRGNFSVDLLVTFGQSDRESFDEQGFSIRSKITNVVLTAADLVLDGVNVRPQRGDQLIHTIGSKKQTYEVIDVGGTKHYRPSDPYGIMIRVNLQLTGVENV